MANPEITNFDIADGVRAVKTSEQALLTTGGAVTVPKLTVLGRIASTGNYGVYKSTNSDGTENPVAVSLNEVVATSSGDFAVSVLLEGKISSDKLVVDGGLTPAIKDSLRDYGIIIEDVTECGELDNQ